MEDKKTYKQNLVMNSDEKELLLDHINNIYNKFEDKLNQLSLLKEFSEILLYINDFNRLCQLILELIINNTVARNCSIMLMDHEQDKLFLAAATNPDGECYNIDVKKIFSRDGLQYTFSTGDGAAGEAVLHKKPVLIRDVDKSSTFSRRNTKVKIGALLTVPLIVQDIAIGVLTLSHPQKETFEENDIKLFTIIAGFTALAINSSLSYKRLQYSEEKYRALADNLNDGIAIIQNGLHKYTNPSYQALSGYSFEDLASIPYTRIIPPRGGNLDEVSTPGRYETKIHTKNGKTLDVEISHAPFTFYGSPAEVISVRDITERKKVEQKYSTIIRTSIDGFWITDKKGRILDVNDAYCKMLGYTRKELLSMNIQDIEALERPQEIAKRLQDILEKGHDRFESRHRAKNGKLIDIDVSVTCFDAGKGQIVAFIRDITEKKKTEKELREKEKKYYDIFKNVSDFLYFHDLEGNFLETNLSFKEDYGYTEHDIHGRNIRDFIPDRYKHLFNDYLNRIKKNGADDGLMAIVTNDGRERIIEYRNSLVYDSNGRAIGVRGVARDITESIQAKRALKESEKKFRSLSENSPDIILTLGKDGYITYINPAFEKILGYKREDVVGRPFLDIVSKADEKQYKDIFKHIREGKELIRAITAPLIHKDGSTRLFSISGAPNINPEGQVTGVIGMLKDITDQQKLQAKLQQAKKMEAVGMLAGGVAHDLNNILTGIVSYPELLLMEIPEDSPLRKPILTIQKSGEKAAAIVQDLLTLARRGVNTKDTVNLNDIITGYLASPEFEKLNLYHPLVKVETNLSKNLSYIAGSKAQLSKVIMNLISNAAEAMPDGGKIFISTENKSIDTPIKGAHDIKAGNYTVLRVSDTGMGISPEDMERIFEPFYTKKVMGRSGTGLGLAVVWAAVRDHKGHIEVKSKQNKGTTFTLYFPASSNKPIRPNAQVPLEKYMGNGESILIVDDMKEQREIACGMLRKLGYKVTAVLSGEEAIEYMKNNSTDLVILDMIMDPGIDGLETYKKILEMHPGQKAIIASGFSETEQVKEAQRLGAGTYIKKPYLLEQIGLAVRNELDR